MRTHKEIKDALQNEFNLTDYEADLVDEIRRKRPTLRTILRHVSQSGMQRAISVIYKNADISYLVAKLSSYRLHHKYDGLKVDGCGMDMGFHVVYNFSRLLFPDGFRYRKNEHHRNGDPSKVDTDGGYALKQQWL